MINFRFEPSFDLPGFSSDEESLNYEDNGDLESTIDKLRHGPMKKWTKHPKLKNFLKPAMFCHLANSFSFVYTTKDKAKSPRLTKKAGCCKFLATSTFEKRHSF